VALLSRDQLIERYRKLGLQHLAKYRYYQSQVDQMELMAMAAAPRHRAGRMSNHLTESTPDEYYAAQICETNLWYKTAVANRNIHRDAATMYFQACRALTDQVSA
jgi:hypothetical protein